MPSSIMFQFTKGNTAVNGHLIKNKQLVLYMMIVNLMHSVL